MTPITSTLHIWRNENPWSETISDITLDGSPVDFSSGSGITARWAVAIRPGTDPIVSGALTGGVGYLTLGMTKTVLGGLPAASVAGGDMTLYADVMVTKAGAERRWFDLTLIVHYGECV